MRERSGWWLWPLMASERLRDGARAHWKRILVGASLGWLLSVQAANTGSAASITQAEGLLDDGWILHFGGSTVDRFAPDTGL